MPRNINLIAAVSLNGVIGDSTTNAMPWHLQSDLKRFREVTFNETVLMGFNTYESIGHPLKNRKNIVITTNSSRAERVLLEGVDAVYTSLMQAAKNESRGFFAIGGERIYAETLNLNPHRMYITVVNKEFSGDVRFPIPGHRFLHDSISVAKTGATYVKVDESLWHTENDIQFKFVTFEIKYE
jgi:dihydrofolate reductase